MKGLEYAQALKVAVHVILTLTVMLTYIANDKKITHSYHYVQNCELHTKNAMKMMIAKPPFIVGIVSHRNLLFFYNKLRMMMVS